MATGDGTFRVKELAITFDAQGLMVACKNRIFQDAAGNNCGQHTAQVFFVPAADVDHATLKKALNAIVAKL
ncbi:MAG TPA: hypothetical protein VGS07_16970 [Thermoanaerobaculia bacterium]|jgi:hypothetical protein|nr:hypothetical protein [Thermoanaerobaculia bacterium]